MARGDPAEVSGSNRQLARERAFRLLALTVTALFLAFAALGGAFVWYDRAAAAVSHTHEVRTGIDGLRQALTDAESAQRAFILTGDSQFAGRVESSRKIAHRQIDTLDRLTADNPLQQRRIDVLRSLFEIRVGILFLSMF